MARHENCIGRNSVTKNAENFGSHGGLTHEQGGCTRVTSTCGLLGWARFREGVCAITGAIEFVCLRLWAAARSTQMLIYSSLAIFNIFLRYCV